MGSNSNQDLDASIHLFFKLFLELCLITRRELRLMLLDTCFLCEIRTFPGCQLGVFKGRGLFDKKTHQALF